MTRQHLLSAGLILLLCASRATFAAPTTGDSLAALAWLAGAWETHADGANIEEHWTPAAGGTMLGINRTVVDDQTVAFEFLRIETRPDGIVYVAHPNARSPGTEFTMNELTGDTVVFRNLSHDFPTLIRYRRNADGSITVTIGGGESGGENPMEFLYSPAR